jgi:hypothetical protein
MRDNDLLDPINEVLVESARLAEGREADRTAHHRWSVSEGHRSRRTSGL